MTTTQALRDPRSLALLVLFGGLAAITTAHGFETIGGYAPCPLCLKQRWAYYVAVPAVALAIWAFGTRRALTFGVLMGLVALAYFANAGLGVYHSGVEWKWWLGPTSCSGADSMTGSVDDLLSGIETSAVVRCDAAPWRMFGLSFAGWSAVISFGLALFASRAASLWMKAAPAR